MGDIYAAKGRSTSTILKSFKPKIMDGVEIEFFKKDERGKFRNTEDV